MNKGRGVSLALGSGGARGFAHIGVIEVLLEEGFAIEGISGSSMGACVGGVYGAGKLDVFKDWVLQLNKRETFRLMDFTMSKQGMMKGQKVLNHLKTILGEIRIEDFEISYTAIATDVRTNQEVWMRNGVLYNVIRASSSIPTLMMPVNLGGKLLIDGGVLNPLPIEPLMAKRADLLVAVNINANKEEDTRNREMHLLDSDKLSEHTEQEEKDYTNRMVSTVKGWLNMTRMESTDKNQDKTLSYFGLLNKTFDVMQDKMCEQSIDLYKPDIVVNVPRNVGTTLEFYRANDMIEEGRTACRRALEKWRKESVSIK